MGKRMTAKRLAEIDDAEARADLHEKRGFGEVVVLVSEYKITVRLEGAYASTLGETAALHRVAACILSAMARKDPPALTPVGWTRKQRGVWPWALPIVTDEHGLQGVVVECAEMSDAHVPTICEAFVKAALEVRS